LDTLDNMRTFLAVVRAGSFSAAARALDTVPSVVAKRIGQLEHSLKTPLFLRSTRSLDLTEAGAHYHRRFLPLVAEIDSAFREGSGAGSGLKERLRIKVPTTLTVSHFGDMLTEFQNRNRGVRMEVLLMDRSVNPMEEGFDLAIGALPATYANVVDIPLCRLRRATVASPAYLEKAGMPNHPGDLTRHSCLSYLATGTSWRFEGVQGGISVDVPSTFGVNDSHILLNALEKHLGIAIMARHIARDAIKAGRLVEILTEFPVPDLWVRALVPESRRHNPAVEALLQWLIEGSQPVSPWDRGED
jgi:DNA-binding transcriptional LysR family regulator